MVRLYDGNVDVPQDATVTVDRMDDYQESQPRLPILLGYASGDVAVASLATITLPLPDAYVATGNLLSVLRFTGSCTIKITSPLVVGTDKIYGKATSTQNGVYAFQGQVSSIQVTNPTAAAITVDYFFCALPDITQESSFRGLETGTASMAEVPA